MSDILYDPNSKDVKTCKSCGWWGLCSEYEDKPDRTIKETYLDGVVLYEKGDPITIKICPQCSRVQKDCDAQAVITPSDD